MSEKIIIHSFNIPAGESREIDGLTIGYRTRIARECSLEWAGRIDFSFRGDSSDVHGCGEWLGTYVRNVEGIAVGLSYIITRVNQSRIIGTVGIPTPIPPAEFDIVHFSVGETSVAGKDAMSVFIDDIFWFKLTVENIGGESGDVNIEVSDGDIIWTANPTLNAKESKTYSWIHTGKSAGENIPYCVEAT